MSFELLWSRRAQDQFKEFSAQDQKRITKAIAMLAQQEGPVPHGLVKVYPQYHLEWGVFQGRAGRAIRYFLVPLGGKRYTITAIARRGECPVNDSER